MVPTEALTFRGGFELMSGHYTSFPDAPFFRPIVSADGRRPLGGNAQSAGDASDLDTVRTPKRTAMIAADYRVAVPGGDLRFSASYYYNSGFAWDPDNRLRQPSYDVLNVSAGWSAPRDQWGVRLWARESHRHRVLRVRGRPAVARLLFSGRAAHVRRYVPHTLSTVEMDPLDRLLNGPLEIGVFLQNAIRIANAVGQLHEQGVIHKDIKPANILVDMPSGVVRLTGLDSPRA